jgi:hypothetical protein
MKIAIWMGVASLVVFLYRFIVLLIPGVLKAKSATELGLALTLLV